MLDESDNAAQDEHYARGIIHYDLGGETYYGHGGFYGSLLLHQPEKDITLSAHIAQANPPFDATAAVAALLQIVEGERGVAGGQDPPRKARRPGSGSPPTF